MERRSLGNTGLHVSVLGLGGAEMGFQSLDVDAVDQLVREAAELGVNVIDTAECYGESESLLGHCLGSRRPEFCLITKCGHPHGDLREDYSANSIAQSIERSLRRLRTSYLDVILLHSCGEAELRGEAISALQAAQQKGHTRFIGYSGDGPAAAYAVSCGAFDILEISINIADQEALDATLPRAVTNGMGVIAKRPLANAAWRYTARPSNEYHQTYWDRLRQLDYPLLRSKPPAEVALRFTLTTPGVTTAIVGTARQGRLTENAGYAALGALTRPDYEALRTHWQRHSGGAWAGEI